MLSSKLLPEMETDDNAKREQLLQGVQNLPIPMQIERLKVSCMSFVEISLYVLAFADFERVLLWFLFYRRGWI